MQNPRSNDVAVLIVDDDGESRRALSSWLERAGCRVTSTGRLREVLPAAIPTCFEVAFVNPEIARWPSEDVVAELSASSPDVKVVLLEDKPAELRASSPFLGRGGCDVLSKPYTSAAAVRALDRALDARDLRAQVRDLQERLDLEAPPAALTTRVPAMRVALDAIGRASRSDVPILLRGPKGVGKKLLGGVLHRASVRAERPFLIMSCATSADQTQIAEELAMAGRLSGVVGGTLLLDEVHLLSLDLQGQLARFCAGQASGATSGGACRQDLRILATTSVDVEALVREGRCRSDLLDLVEIHVPPLRARQADVLTLARHFLEFFARACGRSPPRFSSTFEVVLAGYHWPGNVRELRNVVERAVLLCGGEVLEPLGFAESVAPANVSSSFLGGPFTLQAVERQHILGVIARSRTLDEAARVLGIDTSTLWRRRKKYLDDELRANSSGPDGELSGRPGFGPPAASELSLAVTPQRDDPVATGVVSRGRTYEDCP
jgi:two-component system, NtrC family, response regulator AlgB